MDMDGVDRALALGWEIVRKNSERYKKRRYLFDILNERKQAETIEVVVGLRGSGKTVLLSQLVADGSFAYLSLDYPPLQKYGLATILQYIVKEYQPKHIVLDEFHKKKEVEELRMFYEAYKGEVKVWVSGSSGLEIKSMALERRAVFHLLKPLSLREYLWLKKDVRERVYTLREVLDGKANHLVSYDPYIEDQYREALPFMLSGGKGDALVYGALDDLAAFIRMNTQSRGAVLRLFYHLAETLGEVNFDKASQKTGLPKSQIYRYVELLVRAGLILEVKAHRKGYRKGRKYYLTPPFRATLLQLEGKHVERGTVWEEFFVSQLHPHLAYLPGKGKADFVVDGKVVEVGGKSKGKHQKADIYAIAGRPPKSGEVPLAAFGFLY